MRTLLAATLLLAAAAGAAERPPNIVLILSDDYGINGVGCYGSDHFKGRTPNIDALAKDGLRFDRAYSAPLCGPTRAQLITGRYGFRTGGNTNQNAGQPKPGEESSLARLLKGAGYATASFGKWRQVGGTPAEWGFDEYMTDPTAGGWFWQKSYTKDGKLVETDKEVYCPDVCRDLALDFMRRHKDKPFFLYYPTHLIHGPILRTPDTRAGTGEPAGGRSAKGLARSPDAKAGAGSSLYDDNVAYLDKQVGQLVAEIDKLGLREKTVIIFTGDNGTIGPAGTIGGRELSGRKGTMLEGGAHVPFIASWKGTTPAGKVTKDFVDFSDFYPTFAELAGAKPQAGFTFDGRSFAPQLRGEKGNPREWIFVQLGRKWYVREAAWKLDQDGTLYDMKDAPFTEPAVAADAKDEAAADARKRLAAALAQLNPAGGKLPAPGADTPKRPRAKRANQAPPAAPAK